MTGDILHVVGARPQFVKVAAVLRAAAAPARHKIVHTGQHYDAALSQVFFEELGLPAPTAHLGVGGGGHGAQTGAMLMALEPVLLAHPGALVVVYGDTNSTVAGALGASKLGHTVVHLEAGLRSFDRRMPEELNRVVTDHLSDQLLCPTERAIAQLLAEGRTAGVHLSGDVMLDVALREGARAQATPLGRRLAGERVELPAALSGLENLPAAFALATIHRAGNTDDAAVLARLVSALGSLTLPVLWPVHPRTRLAMQRAGIVMPLTVQTVDPLGYLDFAALLHRAELVLTDSGGVQKEAYFAGRRCITLRDRTEWPETLVGGWNTLVADDEVALRTAVDAPGPTSPVDLNAFGGGRASERCAALIEGLGAA